MKHCASGDSSMRLKSLSPKRTGFERIAGDEEKSVRVSPTFLGADARGGQTRWG